MILKLPWAQKRMFSAFEKSIFQFLANFWVTKLKPFAGKVRKSVQDYLNQCLVMESFLENGFEATLISKTNVVSVWKGHFSFSWKFLSDEVETFSSEKQEKRSKLFKSRFGHNNFLENIFEATLTLKTNVLSAWKKRFWIFCRFLSDKVETVFWESEARHSKLFKSKFGQKKLLRKWFWRNLEL